MRRRHSTARRGVTTTIRIKKNFANGPAYFIVRVKCSKSKIKTIKQGVIPLFHQLTESQKEYFRSIVAAAPGVSSRNLEATTALTARQLGQLKRRQRESEDFIVELP